MEIDFKVTIWTRATIYNEDKDIVLKALKNGEITNISDLYKFAEDPGWKDLYETQEEMTVEDNGGQSTIEAIDDGETVYTNQKQIR